MTSQISVGNGTGNGSLPVDTKPLPEPMLTQWNPKNEWNFTKYAQVLSIECNWKLYFQNGAPFEDFVICQAHNMWTIPSWL